jgi:hypothetical protein
MIRIFHLSLVLILAGFSCDLFATLGETIGSTAQVSKALNAKVIARRTPQYTVHEMAAVGGTVREYIDKAGNIFAVTWRGPLPQDLSLLLGSYFEDYQSQVQLVPKSRNRVPVSIEADDLIVRKEGHMRAMRGKAFLKSFLPSGVRGEDLL